MAQLLELADFRGGYVDLINFVLKHGDSMPSRVAPTIDVNDLLVVVKDPRSALPISMNASFSYDFFMVELAQLIAGVSKPDLMVRVAKNTAQFREEDGSFYGAYGVRTRGQFNAALHKLRTFPEDRQVVVTFWDKSKDLLGAQHKDHPCTLHMRFRIRNGSLETTTVMRSNDVWWGAKYDFPVFCGIHLTMAALLEVPAGSYAHLSHSMHIYTRDIDRLHQVQYPAPVIIYRAVPPLVPLLPRQPSEDPWTWTHASERAKWELAKLEASYVS